MDDLITRLAAANAQLSPKAVPHSLTGNRAWAEEADVTRFAFQRDRDRIIHAQAFRRLMGKTQVFVAGEGDHFRTRLTHTLEVAQLSRDMARTLRLNEDLAECIALAHDLGHPPFGHTGEAVLDAWMRSKGSRFEHNDQSIRIVTKIEEHSTLYPGLNLCREVIDGLRKHEHQRGEDADPPSPEATLVNIADEIAYTAHDTDDGLRAELFAIDDLRNVPLASSALEQCTKRGTSVRGALIDTLVHDVYATGGELSPTMRAELELLRAFLWKHMYGNPKVANETKQKSAIITLLCDAYEKSPPEKVLALQRRTGSTLTEAIKDYVSGMTDSFVEEAIKLI